MQYRNQTLEPPNRLELNQSNFWGQFVIDNNPYFFWQFVIS